MKIEAHEGLVEALRTRTFVWCRARLLHALAGAVHQGVLEEVLEELLEQEGTKIYAKIKYALQVTGWLDPKSAADKMDDQGLL